MMHSISHFINLSSMGKMVTVALISCLSTFSAPSFAADNNSRSDSWGSWKAMGEGYVARRKQPPKLDLPKSERRQASVQERLQHVLNRKVALEEKLTDGLLSDSERKKLERRLRRLDKRIVRLQEKNSKIDEKIARRDGSDNIRSRQNSRQAIWLHTKGEGLVGASITEMADTLNISVNELRRMALQGDLILTGAEKLDSKKSRHPISWHYDQESDSLLFVAENYDTFYSDENAYKVLLNAKHRSGNPMAVVRGNNSSASVTNPGKAKGKAKGKGSVTVGSGLPFRDTLEFEKEPDFFYSTWSVYNDPGADYWWWDYLYGAFKTQINLDLLIPNPSAIGTAQVRVTIRGFTDVYPGDDHSVSAQINGVAVGTGVTWDGFEQVVLVADFDQSILNQSGNNTFTLISGAAPGTYPGQWLDRVEIDYERSPAAHDGQLWMHDVAAGVHTVTGFASDNIIVVESPNGEAVLRQDLSIQPDGDGGWQASFTAEGGDFFLADFGNVMTSNLTRDNRARLTKRYNRADYLIIAPRDFAESATALAEYRDDRYSAVKIAWIDDIYNEFSAGREDPEALARFMRHVVENWEVSPSAVILLGKGTFDQKDRQGYSDSFVPIAMTGTPWEVVSSDTTLLGYADNAPFAIGRLPITSDLEGMAYLEKLKAYEASTPPAFGATQAVLVADNPDKGGRFDTNMTQLGDDLLNDLGFDMLTELFHPQVNVRANFTAAPTWNTDYVVYDGHGSVTQLGNEGFMTSADAANLNNTVYPVFSALTCAVGNDTHPGIRSLVGELVLNPTGGAIASVAANSLSHDIEAQVLSRALAGKLFTEEGTYTVGEALRQAKQADGIRAEFMPRIYSVIGDPTVYIR